tara:strand:- start:120 stop:311 length:192 start_codon:yes stop_codon:yes gene_type:complete
MKVYKFNSESEALDAQSQLNTAEGIPVENGETQNVSDVAKYDGVWCLDYCVEAEALFGEPEII